MADKSKIEAMLEKLVNEDKAGAEELFHEFVIEKSREIYEGLLENDLEELDIDEATDEEVDETTDEEVDEATDEDEDEEEVDESTDEEVEEASDEEVEEAEEETEEGFEFEADDDPMGGDATDDMMGDLEMGDDEGGDEGDDEDEGDIEDRVVDLEDALDDLKDEFAKMMADEGDDEGEGDDEADMDMGDEEGDEEAEEESFDTSDLGADYQPAYEGEKSEAERMREYVEKVAEPKGEDNKAKSPVAGKNDMGGTASNLNQGSAEEKGMKASAPKEDNAGNVNVPGGKASKSMSNNSKGHGAEKKGAGESGADGKSIIGS